MQPAVNQKRPQREAFPICLFSLYVLFYSGQSIYNTYLNLYLSSEGLSDSQIGFIISVSTLFILLAQLFWGWVSDRVKVKTASWNCFIWLPLLSAFCSTLEVLSGFCWQR